MDTNRWIKGVSIIGAFISSLLGGYDALLEAMLFMMILDIIAGVLCAAFFNTSKYSKNGVSSEALIKGAIRKIMMLFIIAISVIIDRILNINYVRNCAVLYMIGTEGISLLEHMVNMNVPFPKFVKDLIETILEKGDNGNES